MWGGFPSGVTPRLRDACGGSRRAAHTKLVMGERNPELRHPELQLSGCEMHKQMQSSASFHPNLIASAGRGVALGKMSICGCTALKAAPSREVFPWKYTLLPKQIWSNRF